MIFFRDEGNQLVKRWCWCPCWTLLVLKMDIGILDMDRGGD